MSTSDAVTPPRRPVILAVDDDPPVLSAVRADLRAHYAAEYRIVAADSGGAALEAVEELHRRGDTVALFLSDQRMPAMTGIEFLLAAAAHFPEAKRVLLTAYADTEVAIRAINDVDLDHYLMKPWAPPEEHLYPVLDDLLGDWVANRPAAADGLRVIGPRWSAATYDLKDFLARNQIPYRFLDVEREPEARVLVDGLGQVDLPVVLLPDGDHVSRPDHRTLAARIGLRVEASAPFYDLIVVGAGPAGLAAAVYGASEGLRVVVLEREGWGGQAGTSSLIENYLGFHRGVSGSDLARRAYAQARRFGAEFLSAAEVVRVEVRGPARAVRLSDGAEIAAHALLVATGGRVVSLDAPGAERLTGAGVYYGATPSEAVGFTGDDVVIVGGANSAGQAAMLFSRHAKRVRLVVRGPSLERRMSRYLVDQVGATENIEVLLGHTVADVRGGDRLEEVVLEDRAGQRVTLEARGLFVFVGARPHTDFLRGVVELNDQGFVLTGPDLPVDVAGRPRGWSLHRDPYLLETSVPGVFAAGDVRHGAMRRVASAVGEGSLCISFVHGYLES